MSRYVIDAFAWIEYFLSSAKGQKVKEIVEDARHEIFISPLTLSEVMSLSKREQRDYEEIYMVMLSLARVFPVDELFFKEVGLLHAEIRQKIKDFGMIDVAVLLTARKLNAKVLTGDPHFKGFREAVLI